MQNILIIGGTGILGKPMATKLIDSGDCIIYSVALAPTQDLPFPASVQQIVADRNSDSFPATIRDLNKSVGTAWNAVIDLIAYDEKSGKQTYELFKDCAKHIITLSTTLVYDRREKSNEPISEETPLAPEWEYGGYVDGKVRLEKFWQQVGDVPWTLLRPYHVLGKWSLLGCLPHHNRDPKLIERINTDEVLQLANDGHISLNFIHPDDVATAIIKIIGNSITFNQAYNLVNPTVISGREYYEEIGKQLGKEIRVENISITEIWEEKKGWEMTTLPHVYSIEKLKNDIGFVPSIQLTQAIKNSLANYPAYDVPVEDTPVHKHMNTLPRPKKPTWLV